MDEYFVGIVDGYGEGYFDGMKDGYNDGQIDGMEDGNEDGRFDGSMDGCEDGSCDGIVDGVDDGVDDGIDDACTIGSYDGVDEEFDDAIVADGTIEGEREGTNDGILIDCANDGGRLGGLDEPSTTMSMGTSPMQNSDGHDNGGGSGGDGAMVPMAVDAPTTSAFVGTSGTESPPVSSMFLRTNPMFTILPIPLTSLPPPSSVAFTGTSSKRGVLPVL